MASGIVEPSQSGSSQEKDRERDRERAVPSAPRALLVQKLTAAGADLPEFITSLIETQAIMVAGTEAVAFIIEPDPERKGANLRVVKHIRPDDSAPDVRQRAIEEFARIVAPCVEQGKDGVIQIGDQPPDKVDPQFCLVTLLRADEQIVAVSAVISRAPNSQRAEQRLTSMQLVAGYFEIFTLKRGMEQIRAVSATNQSVLQLATSVATAEGFESAAMSLCNELATRTGATRVAIGWLVGNKIKLKAMSHTEKFDKKQELSVLIVAAMEECLDQEELIQYEPEGASSDNVTRASAELSRTQGGVSVLSLPLRRGGEVEGVITLEFNPQKKLGPNAATSLAVAVELLAPQLYDRYQNDRYLITKTGHSIVWLGEQVFRSPKHMLAKTITLLVVIGLLFITLFTTMYHVVAPFAFASTEKRIISSPYDGFIGGTVNVIPGAHVKAGDVLLAMDDHELVLKKTQAESTALAKKYEAQKYSTDPTKTAEQMMAMKESAASQAEADTYQYEIDQSVIKAPFDGVVLSGDWMDKKHSPVRKGDELFKLAQNSALRVEIQVPESDIQWLHDDGSQKGTLATTSLPTEKFAFHVERIIPLPDIKEGKNTFKVYGTPEQVSDQWRDGMQGEVRIDVEKKSLAWIWTHRLIDWIHLKTWM